MKISLRYVAVEFIRPLAVVALLLILTAYAARSDQPAPAPAPSPAVIIIKDFAFSPSSVTVPVGGTVIWKNQDGVAHTATSTTKAFDSGNLDDESQFTFTFLKPGTYPYVCSYHPNMTGEIIVQATPSPSH